MHAILNETQLCYCDIWDETISFLVGWDILNLHLINTKKNMALLLKNRTLSNQKLMRWILHSVLLLKVVKTNVFFSFEYRCVFQT